MRALLLLIVSAALFAQPELEYQHVSPEEIQGELDQAERDLKRAEEMFNPWYTGPLITPSASLMPVGQGNTQPYLFVTDTYAAYNRDRESIDLPSSRVSLKGTTNLLTGVTNSMDFNVNIGGAANWQNDNCGGGFSDMSIAFGFLINRQGLYAPAAKLSISQTFPTGNYKNLNPSKPGVDAVGGGAYATSIGLAFSKLLFWATQHPANVRLFVSYQLSTVVDVNGFNSYGGGFGCVGRVRPGNTFNADFGAEVSLTQNWVASMDVVYTASDATKFHGDAGTLADGSPSSVGNGYSDQLSLAPAIEYNFNPNIGLLAGVWFSVYGRTSGDFVSGIVSFSYSFP